MYTYKYTKYLLPIWRWYTLKPTSTSSLFPSNEKSSAAQRYLPLTSYRVSWVARWLVMLQSYCHHHLPHLMLRSQRTRPSYGIHLPVCSPSRRHLLLGWSADETYAHFYRPSRLYACHVPFILKSCLFSGFSNLSSG